MFRPAQRFLVVMTLILFMLLMTQPTLAQQNTPRPIPEKTNTPARVVRATPQAPIFQQLEQIATLQAASTLVFDNWPTLSDYCSPDQSRLCDDPEAVLDMIELMSEAGSVIPSDRPRPVIRASAADDVVRASDDVMRYADDVIMGIVSFVTAGFIWRRRNRSKNR